MNKLLLLLFITTNQILSLNGERTKDKMYEYIDGSAACFRRLNGTHQTGCTSRRPGSTGVIHHITESNFTMDLDFVLTQGPAAPYIALMPITYFNRDLLTKLSQYSDRIAGVVLHQNVSRPTKHTHELTCPNRQSNLDESCTAEAPWNPAGSGLLHADIPFPVFLVHDQHNLEKLISCFETFNNYDHSQQNLRALCSLELASFMFATKNSESCIRRSSSVTNFTPTRFCDPLGNRNVWATLKPRITASEVILITAQLDSTTMFYDVTPGAAAPLTGLVTLMTTAFILKEMSKHDDSIHNKTIMFAIFSGESYDYIGSQRMIYDISTKAFPMSLDPAIKNPVPLLSLSDIHLIIDLGQLNMAPNSAIFTHHIKYNDDISQNRVSKFTKTLQKHSELYNISISEPTPNTHKNHLPPSSLQSFLRENETIAGMVLANHNSAFSNQFYHSVYDTHENIGYKYQNGSDISADSIQRYIANVSAILARSLLDEVRGNTEMDAINVGDTLGADRIVDELFHCYLDTANCSLYQAVALKERISERPFGLYVSVDPHGNKMATLAGFTLAWLMGDRTNITKDNCTTDPHNPVYQYVWMSQNISNINDTICFRTTMNFSQAISPAFVIEDYDWSSNRYSSWTESVWSDIYMRMFLTPSRRHEIMTISVGTCTFVLSLALVYFVHTRADILFAKPDAITPGTSC